MVSYDDKIKPMGRGGPIYTLLDVEAMRVSLSAKWVATISAMHTTQSLIDTPWALFFIDHIMGYAYKKAYIH